LVSTGIVAIKPMSVFAALRLRVPEDVPVTGFDSYPAVRHV